MKVRMASAVLLLVVLSAERTIEARMSRERRVPDDGGIHPDSPEDPDFPAPAVDHRIRIAGTSNPEPLCGSAIECARLTATIDAPCRWNPAAGGFVADAVLVTIGEMYFYNGPVGSFSPFTRVSGVDKKVTSAREARRHGFEWHIDLASAHVAPLIGQLRSHSFQTAQSCENGASAVRRAVTRSFLQKLRETQEVEEMRREDPRTTPTALVLPLLSTILPEEAAISVARGK